MRKIVAKQDVGMKKSAAAFKILTFNARSRFVAFYHIQSAFRQICLLDSIHKNYFPSKIELQQVQPEVTLR